MFPEIEEFANTKPSVEEWDEFSKGLKGANTSLKNFLTNEKYGEKTLASYTQYLKDQNKIIDLQTLKTKALTIAKNAMVNVGMAVVSTLIANGIGFVVEQLDNYIHRLDIAKEKLSNTQSELDTVNSEITEINKKIAELTALDPSSLSITDKEDLQRLKDQNEELRIRQQYLKDQAKYDAGEVAKHAKEKYQKKYSGETTRENIDAYKSTMYSEYDDAYANTGYSIYENPNFSPSAQAEYESDTLTVLIATLEHLREERQKAIDAQDSEAIEEYNTQIKETEASLRAERLELQGLRDDMEAVGGVEFEDANHRIGMIDDALYTPGQNLVTFINEDIIDNDKNKLVELAESGKLTSDVLKKSFSEVEEYLKNNGLTIEDLVSVLDVYKEQIQEIEEEASKIPSTKTQMIDTINSMADGFDVLDDIYADVLDGGTFDFTKLDTSKFSEAFSEITPEYEKFIETVSASPTDIDACQGAFNDLVSAFIDSKGILEGVDEETKQLTIDMLENMGVVNAEEVVMSSMGMAFENYALAKQEASNAGINLMNATDAEIQQLLLEDSTSRQTAQGLFLYQMQKALSNATTLQTFGDIENLKALGLSLGLTSDLLDDFIRLIQIKNDISLASQLGDRDTVNVLTAEAEALTASIKEQASSFKTAYTPIANYGGASKTAAVAQDKLKDSTKKATDALEKQKEVLNEQKSELEALHGAIIDYIDDEIDDIDDKTSAIEKQNDKLKDQLDIYDDIISAVTNNIDIEIDAIDDKIDKLRDANEEEEKALALEEAKRKNLEANSRKTKLVYQEGKGFVYEKDEKAIKESESELENLQEEALIDSLEKEKELLEENKQKWLEIADAGEKALQTSLASKYFGSNWRDTTLNPSDEMIGKLQGDYVGTQIKIEQNDSRIEELNKEKEFWENEKKLWQDALDEYEKQQNRARLESFFGSDYEYQLLNNSAVWRRKFADEYSSICAEIEALEERIKTSSETTTSSVESGANRISNAANGVKGALENTGNISKYIWTEADTAALEFAKGRLDTLNTLIGQGRTELTDARDKVAAFVEQYAQLEDSRIVTDNLKSSVSDLNGIYSETDTLFNDVLEGVDGRLSNMSSYVQEVDSSSQTLADNLSTVSQAIQEMKTSEETIEAEAEETVSNVEITISNLLTKLGELQTKLGEISLFRTEVETITDEELLDTSTVVDGVHTKVGEIQSAMTLLLESITPLEGALDTLMEKLTTLDEVTLSGVIGAFGGASGGEGGESKESGSKSSSKGKKGSEGESVGGSGLLSAVKAVDEAIGSVDNEESLLGKLAQVDASTLKNIIAQFGLSGENGDSEGANLLNAVNAVSQAIVGGGKDDENSLIASIEQLGSDPTIEHVTTVSDSFQTLHDTINECVKKVEELSKAIESIPSSTATVGVNGGKSSGRAKGGIITKEDEGDLDFVAKSLGEDHMVALTEGEAVIPKENVAKNPEVVQSLIDGKTPALDLENYTAIREGVEIKRPEWVLGDNDKTFTFAGRQITMKEFNALSEQLANRVQNSYPSFHRDVLNSMAINKPFDYSNVPMNSNQQQTVIQINGDLSFPNIKSGNDAELLIKDISNMANKARQRSARR